MQMSKEEQIMHVAKRAASVLLTWLNLNPLTKRDNGARGQANQMAQLMGSLLVQKAQPLPEGVEEKIVTFISSKLCAAPWLRLDVDYGPNKWLLDLSEMCGIDPVLWPIKSSLFCSLGSGQEPPYVSSSRGYRSQGCVAQLTDAGWLISDMRCPSLYLDAVLRAVQAGGIEGVSVEPL